MLRTYKFEDVAKSGWQFFIGEEEVSVIDRKNRPENKAADKKSADKTDVEVKEKPTDSTLEGYTVDTIGNLGLGSSYWPLIPPRGSG